MGMLGPMGILKTFTDELRRVQAERETQDLLEVLRRRLDTLTFGELAGLVTSTLGKGLATVKISALLAPAASRAEAPSAPRPLDRLEEAPPKPAGKKAAKKSKATRKGKTPAAASNGKTPKAKKAAAKKKAAKSKPPTKAKKTVAKKKAAATSRVPVAANAAKDQAVLRAIAAAKEPLGIQGIVSAAKLSQSQANRTLRRLIDAGTVRMVGPKQRATYTLAQGTAGKAAESKPAPASAEGTTNAGPGVTGRTAAGREAYDEAILSTLRDTGDWTAASDLRATVGGTSEQLRIGLGRLVSAGKIVKTGDRSRTRYKLTG